MFHSRKRTRFSTLVFCMTFFVPVATAQTIVHVDDDAPPSGNGADWETAYKFLQDGLIGAESGTEIRVAGGTYRPDQDEANHVTLGDRESTFNLVNGVVVKGGYAGLANLLDPNARDITVYETTLSGDIGASGDDSDNSFHVVTARDTDNSALLDGFTITGGNANPYSVQPSTAEEDSHNGLDVGLNSQNQTGETCGGFQGIPCGGFCKLPVGGCCCDFMGVCVVAPSPSTCPSDWDPVCGCDGITYTNECWSDAASMSLNNRGTCPHGGGIYNDRGSPTINNCTFRDNSAIDSGGAMYAYQGNPTVTSCIFERNYAEYGSAVAITESEPLMQGCILRDNSAEWGGAMDSWNSRPTLRECVFARNVTSQWARGAGLNNRDSEVTLIDCVFKNNSAGSGGALFNVDSSVSLINCLLVGNQAVGDRPLGTGGAIENHYGNDITLSHCTFVRNSATRFGGGVQNFSSTLSISDSIFWANTDGNGMDESAQIHRNIGATQITYSCIQGLDTLAGNGNIGADPLFVPGPGGCFYLSQTAAGQARQSPSVDTGSDTALAVGLDLMTTRSDEEMDTGVIDLGYHYRITDRPLVMGDFDRNTAVDLADFANWTACMTVPGPTDVSPCCRIFDFEHDNDVDLEDFAAFLLQFNP